MTGALRYEWVRITSIRSTWWLTGIAVLLSFGFSLLIGQGLAAADEFAGTGFSASSAAVITQGSSTGFAPVLPAFVMGLLGVFAFGHEYRHGMIRATLTAVPRRWQVVLAKTAVTAAWAAAVATACVALGALAGELTVGDAGFSVGADEVPRVMVGYVVFTALFALVGMGIAMVVRHQAGALGLLLLLPVVVEGIIRLVLTLPSAFDDIEGVARYLPFDAGGQMLVLFPLDANLPIGPPPLDPLPGGLTFAVFTAAVIALGTALFVQRDA